MLSSRILLGFLFSIMSAMLLSPLCAQTRKTDSDEVSTEDRFGLLVDFFNYDTAVPLDARIVERSEHNTYVREKLVFRGIRDSRVPAYLAIPAEGGPHACVLLIHGVGGSKADWWQESFHGGEKLTSTLLSAGFAVMTLDVQYHGERAASNDYESPEVFLFQSGWVYRARDMVVDSVIEHRRAMDYLVTRDEIDSTRIGVIGYSMGGMMAFQLTAVEPRIQTSVSCVSPILKTPPSALAVGNFATHLGDTPFLMMIGKDDSRNYTVEDAEEVLDQISSEDKELVVFESGHKLPSDWVEKSASWIERTLSSGK